jgi:hypothetical protein
MNNPLEYFWKEDPLKAADDLIKHSNFDSPAHDKDYPINVSLLLLASIFLAFTKSLYGIAGFTLTQHLITSLILVFIGYIVVGIAFLAFLPYQWVTNRLRCLLTCLIAALTVSLFLVYFSEPITDGGIFFIDLLHLPDRLADRLADATPAIVFSAVGCFAIYRLKRRSHARTWADRRTFVYYWAITSFIFYFLAFDRRLFFDNVMSHISNLKLF